uniref:Uncharacterized protein n=1 Tax=Anguilla anguilla TaxID=7936 RepID=A0A0E9RMZ7_ANGAN
MAALKGVDCHIVVPGGLEGHWILHCHKAPTMHLPVPLVS